MEAGLPQIPVFDVRVEQEDIDAVADVLRTGRLEAGPQTEAFEREFAAHLGVEHVVAVSSCTAALHLACIAAGVGPGDEVIVPSLTFVATANCVRYCGARPVFCDLVAGEGNDLNLDVDLVEPLITERTKAVICVHWGGYAVAIEQLAEICDRHGLALIEDTAHAPIATAGGRALGSFGTGCFSFFPNKVLGVGEGGAVSTNSDEVAKRVRALASHGVKLDGDVPEPGFNYRFDDLRAAFIRPRLRRLGTEVERRRELIVRYRELFSDAPDIGVAYEGNDASTSSCYLMGVLVPAEIRSRARERLREEHGIQTTVYPAIHRLDSYVREYGPIELPRTEAAAASLFAIPLSVALSDADQERVADAVKSVVAEELA